MIGVMKPDRGAPLRLGFLTVLLFAGCLAIEAQDARWIRRYERAQEERPEKIGPVGRIAPASEPGTPMVIRGRVFGTDGVTAMPNVLVFAYQTDAGGLYHERGRDGWRLKGWVRTDDEGRFEFRTIRPGSYPSGRTPAHVHLILEGPGVPRQWADGLQFADDPLLPEAERERARRSNHFAGTRPVEERNGVQYVELHVRASRTADF